jgi:hypothetical protein
MHLSLLPRIKKMDNEIVRVGALNCFEEFSSIN